MRTDIGTVLILVWALVAAVLGDLMVPRPAPASPPLVSARAPLSDRAREQG